MEKPIECFISPTCFTSSRRHALHDPQITANPLARQQLLPQLNTQRHVFIELVQLATKGHNWISDHFLVSSF